MKKKPCFYCKKPHETDSTGMSICEECKKEHYSPQDKKEERINNFKANILCFLFGHALPKPPYNFHETPKESRSGLIVVCERCHTNQPLKSFRAYRTINHLIICPHPRERRGINDMGKHLLDLNEVLHKKAD